MTLQNQDIKILDCTLRDGGYYNSWNFPLDVVNNYLSAMKSASVNIVELGLRSLINHGFKGASAYTTDQYISTLDVPEGLDVAVMVNGSELVGDTPQNEVLELLFPNPESQSPVNVVRIACHVHEFVKALPACNWLKERGYSVGFNLMQIADRNKDEVIALALEAQKYPIDSLYFADSMGSMDPEQTKKIISWIREGWQGNMGIHTHDNMGLAMQNTLTAINCGVTWLDATVTGMGRGPGNARTEELAIEIQSLDNRQVNLVPLMSVINQFFQPLKNKCGWGSNPYYYLSGKHGIHPTFIQEMLSDSRYSEEDILATIDRLKVSGGKKFSKDALSLTRESLSGEAKGTWQPSSVFEGKKVLLVGTGPGVAEHRVVIESYIEKYKPVVLALNTQSAIKQELIDFRLACHPVRLLADCNSHTQLPQPLITPKGRLSIDILDSLKGKELLDFGMSIKPDTYNYSDTDCVIPTSLVICYALAVINSGSAKELELVGFDGYGADDPRNNEMNKLIKLYNSNPDSIEACSLTPTRYDIASKSIYGLMR